MSQVTGVTSPHRMICDNSLLERDRIIQYDAIPACLETEKAIPLFESKAIACEGINLLFSILLATFYPISGIPILKFETQ